MGKPLRNMSFSDIRFRRQNNGEPPEPKDWKVIGLDTETYEGKPKLIADSTGEWAKIGELEDIINFLTSRRFQQSINGFWNMDFDFRALQTLMHREDVRTLYYLGEIQFPDFKLEWIPRKYFGVQVDSQTYRFFDFQQFYHTSLERAGKRFLGESKKDIRMDLMNVESYWMNNYSKIVDYCIQDCKLTAKLGRLMKDKMNHVGIRFYKPFSSGFLAADWLKTHCNLPTFKKRRAELFAMRSYYGGRFEVFKRGYFPEVYLYDINSAFPYQMSKLPDFSRGRWSRKKNDIVEDHEGFVKCRVRDLNPQISNVPHDTGKEIIFPNMEDKVRYLTLDEYRYLENSKYCDVEPLLTWYFIPSTDERPFSVIGDLYEKKNEYKGNNESLYTAYKRILNSCYGKTVETYSDLEKIERQGNHHDLELFTKEERGCYKKVVKPGSIFYPPIGSLISGKTRVQLAEQLCRKPDSTIATFTDCVVTTAKLGMDSKELGGWDLDFKGEGVFIGSGVYSIRNGEGVKSKTRGFNLRDYDNLFEALEDNRNKDTLEVVMKNPVTTGEIFHFDRLYSFEDLNRFEEKTKRIEANFDDKRNWEREAMDFGDLLDNRIHSKPKVLE